MSNLTPELQQQIEQEAKDEAKKMTARVPAFRIGYEHGYYDGADKYVEKRQLAEADKVKLNRMLKSAADAGKKAMERAGRYEKALDYIATFYKTSEAEIIDANAVDGYNAIIQVAREALTTKPTTDDTANG